MGYRAKDMEAMRELYSSIDRGASRTKANVIASYLEGTKQFAGTTPSLIRLIGEGLALWLWEGSHERSRHDGDEIAYLMQNEHKNVTNAVLAYCMQNPKVYNVIFMRRAPVLAAMFETFSKVVQPSVDFWESVKNGTGFESTDDPRLKLRNALQNTKLVTSSLMTRTKSIDRETQ